MYKLLFGLQTLFSIGSCSKAFAAAAMGILMDDFAQGKNVTALPHGLQSFTWETKIQDLLPGEWELSDRWATEKADLRDVLSHVSGLPRHVRVSCPMLASLHCVSSRDLLGPVVSKHRQHVRHHQKNAIVEAYIRAAPNVPI